MKRKNYKERNYQERAYEGRDWVEGKSYTLVGKEHYLDGYFVFDEDAIEGKGVVAVFLIKELFDYDDLIVGDDYRVTRERGFFNYSKMCRNVLNTKH